MTSSTESEPWWKTEMYEATFITEVRVISRSDAQIENLNNYTIYIGNNSDFTQNSKC
jgi:hypothetical protein